VSGTKSRLEAAGSSQLSPSTRRKNDASAPAAVGSTTTPTQHGRPHHHHPHHHHHHRSAASKGTPSNAANAQQQACQAKTLSPSESEAWSEPDRNVSQQRIGLDQETLLSGSVVAVDEDGLDGASANQQQQQHSTSSSSDADSQKLTGNSSAPSAAATAASLARAMQQNRKLAHKIKALELVNDSLKVGVLVTLFLVLLTTVHK
jgi:hypothetical protein